VSCFFRLSLRRRPSRLSSTPTLASLFVATPRVDLPATTAIDMHCATCGKPQRRCGCVAAEHAFLECTCDVCKCLQARDRGREPPLFTRHLPRPLFSVHCARTLCLSPSSHARLHSLPVHPFSFSPRVRVCTCVHVRVCTCMHAHTRVCTPHLPALSTLIPLPTPFAFFTRAQHP
jgi:hypothetical protein